MKLAFFNEFRLGVIRDGQIVDATDSFEGREFRRPQDMMEELITGWDQQKPKIESAIHNKDGVSLESAKWAQVLWDHRHVSYWYAGKLDRDPDVSVEVPHAHFGHPDIVSINERIYGRLTRDSEVTRRIYAISEHLKKTLFQSRLSRRLWDQQ